MFRSGVKLVSSVGNRRALSTVTAHNNKNAFAPLVEKHRPVWPDADFAKDSQPAPLPVRTVPESALKFRMTSSFDSGSAILYSHLSINPADIKVKMTVSVDQIDLTADEKAVLQMLVGKSRYNSAKREIRLTSEKFPNRIENKRYLTLQIQQLVDEARRLTAQRNELSK